MNSLEQLIAASHMDEFAVLNRLDEAGLISNHCVRAMDVADADCKRAVKWLKEKENYERKNPS